MTTFTRATESKEHRNNVMDAAKRTIDTINKLTTEYESVWQKLEGYRKERAALIEDIIKIVKDGNIKLRKQLCRCDNQELNDVLEEVVDDLDLNQQEVIKCALVKINIRYKQIAELGKKLEGIMQELSHFRTMEADYTDEVVIPYSKLIADRIKKKAMATPAEEEELEEVVSTSFAPPSIVISIGDFLENNKKEVNLADEEKEIAFSAIIEESEFAPLYEQKSDIEGAVPNIEEEYPEATVTNIIASTQETNSSEQIPDETDFVEFKIENNITLSDIAERVYSSKDYWEALYSYGMNKSRIDRIAAEYNLPYQTICTESGYLNGVELQFPLELVMYDVVSPDKGLKRVA